MSRDRPQRTLGKPVISEFDDVLEIGDVKVIVLIRVMTSQATQKIFISSDFIGAMHSFKI